MNIHSPVPLEKQKYRDVFSKYGILGPVHGAQYLNENRFIKNEKDLTTFCSKYKSYNSPNFKKSANHSIDEFIKNEGSCAGENANSQIYYPSYVLAHRNEDFGVPNFNRYTQH